MKNPSLTSRFVRFAGLTPKVASPPLPVAGPETALTEEAAVTAPGGGDLRITPLVAEGDLVGEGAPLACLRDAPDIRLVAPMPGRVAEIALRPGHRLSEIVLYREAGGDIAGHDLADADAEPGLRRLMQRAGLWPMLRRRPFGGMPGAGERPAAIFVMMVDTRPHAPDPVHALMGREAAFDRGLAALVRLTEGPVVVCGPRGASLPDVASGHERIRLLSCGPRHPQGLAGMRIHDGFPAGVETPVWDINAEEVAALGGLLETGRLPMTRLVSVTGPALRAARLVHTQWGADLRALTRRIAQPGPHLVLSGSALDGHPSRWLAARDRQVTVLPRDEAPRRPHWLTAALTRSARPEPVIPTAALSQSMGGALPAASFVRALSSGDEEAATRLGLLSLLEEDVALADYVLGGAGLPGLLRAMLDRVRAEVAP